MGPLISAQQRDTVRGYVDEVEVAFEGSTPGGDGFWVPPTVVLTEDPADRIWREEVFGPVVAVMPFDDEARRDRAGQRHRVRPVRVDLHPRPRPRAAGGPGRRGRQPERQLALLGALLDAVRRLQAVRPRPRARAGRAERVHRGEERLHRPLTGRGSRRRRSDHERTHGRTHPGQGRRGHRGLLRDRAGDRAAVRRGGRDRSSSATSTSAAATSWWASSAARTGDLRPGRRHRQGPGRRAVPGREGHLRLGRHRVQQRRHLAARGRLDPGHRPGRLAAGAGGQPDQRLPVLQGRAPLHAASRARARSSTPRRSSR